MEMQTEERLQTESSLAARLRKLHEERFGTKLIVIVLSVLMALLIGAIFLLILGVDPFTAYFYLLVRPFRSFSSIGELSIRLTPILLTAVGVSFSFSAKLSNLGGEGQICLGAIGMTLIGTSALGESLGVLSLPLGMVTAALFGALWAGIAGFVKSFFKASEIITTLMLNYIAIQLMSWCVYYPLRDPEGNIPQSAKIAAELPKLFEGSRMNLGIIIAIAALIIYAVVMYRTRFGFKIRVLGGSPEAARYAGIKRTKYYIIIMCLSGVFTGIAGAIEVAGTQTRLLEGLAGSYGLTGVVASLLGMLHPVGVALSSVLLAALESGSEAMQVKTGVSSLFVNMLEALIVLFILLGMSLMTGPGLGVFKRKIKRTEVKA